MVEYVNNNEEKVKVQVFDSGVGWKTLYKGDKVVAFNPAYEEAYEKAGLTKIEVKEVVEPVVKKKTRVKKKRVKRK